MKPCFLCGKPVDVVGWEVCADCIIECREARGEAEKGHCYDVKDIIEELNGGPPALTQAELDRGWGI